MKEADIVLASLAQADGRMKCRPALLLRELPPFRDFLVCGISTQLHQTVPAFDVIIAQEDSDFSISGLVTDSVIRLGFLAVLPRTRILGILGEVSRARHARLLSNLSAHLLANQ